MATFQELEDRARSEIVAEVYEDQYQSAQMQNDLWNSSVEMAALFGFPIVLKQDVAVTAGDEAIAPPADMRQALNLIVNGDQGVFADMKTIIQERAPGQGPLRVFNFDPRRGGDIQLGPATDYTGNATLEYVQSLTKPGVLSSGTPWSGLMPEWHWLIIYHAASRLFQEAEREDETPYWMQIYQSGITSFAVFLGRGDVADLMLGGMKAGASAQARTPQQPQATQQAQQTLGYGGMLGQ